MPYDDFDRLIRALGGNRRSGPRYIRSVRWWECGHVWMELEDFSGWSDWRATFVVAGLRYCSRLRRHRHEHKPKVELEDT